MGVGEAKITIFDVVSKDHRRLSGTWVLVDPWPQSLRPLGSLHGALRSPRCRPAATEVKRTPGSSHSRSRGAEGSPAALPTRLVLPGLTMPAPRASSGPAVAPGLACFAAVENQSPRALSADLTAPRRKRAGGRGTSALPAGAPDGTAHAPSAARLSALRLRPRFLATPQNCSC